MPRPMLRTPKQQIQQTNTILNATNNQQQQKQKQQLDKMKMDRLLRQKRSKTYMDAIHKLDAGGHVQNQQKVNEIINAIQSELPEIELAGIMLGIVSVCYLGRPYEVHSLTIAGSIIQHFKQGEPMPNGLDRARNIAIRGGYDFIEVYTDCCRAVSADGTVSVISC